MKLVLLVLVASTNFAQQVSAAEPVLEWHIFADSYYAYNFNRPAAVAAPSGTSASNAALPDAKNIYRYYDTYHDQLTLNLVELSVAAKFEEVSFLVDLDFGPFADLNAASGSTAAGSRSVDEVAKHVGQAVLSYRPQGSRFSFDAGKLYSHMGLETVKSKDNWNYSRSTLFNYSIPFWHTGLRLGYDLIPGQLQASVFAYNGWNSIYDNNHSKTFGAQLKYTPKSTVSIGYNYIGGPERTDSQRDMRSVHELNTTWGLSDSVSLASDAVYGREDHVTIGTTRPNAVWYGGLIGLKYNFSETSYISPRYEVFRDQHGFLLGFAPQTLKSATLTYGQNLSKGLDVRTEARWDSSSKKPFSKGMASEKDQATLLAALLFVY